MGSSVAVMPPKAARRRPKPSQPPRPYGWLLAVCVLMLVTFALPVPWNRLSSPGYLLLGMVMMVGLGDGGNVAYRSPLAHRLFRWLGATTLVMSLLWMLTPLDLRSSGVPVLLLWALFSGWSAIRLIRGLARERAVSGQVLHGALAGYLMLGLAAGLLCSSLETILPGSFSNVHLEGATPTLSKPVWGANFVRLNYFAFVSLTTMGFGDVTPLTPQAQMVSVLIAIAGTFYVAAVMGLLISRLTVQESREEEEEAEP